MKKMTLVMTLVFSLTSTVPSFASMSMDEYIETTSDETLVNETQAVGENYNQIYENIEQMSDDQFSSSLNEAGNVLLQYAKDYSDKDGKDELELLANTYIELSKDKESKPKILKFLSNVGTKAGMGTLKGVFYVAGDGANILYNVAMFPRLILKDLIKVVLRNKTKDDLLTGGGKIRARTTVLVASTLINWGFPPKVKDQDYDAQFNPKKIGTILVSKGVEKLAENAAAGVVMDGFSGFGEKTWNDFIMSPVSEAKAIDKTANLVLPSVSPAVSYVAIALGVMNMISNTSCLVQEAHVKAERNQAGAALEKLCNRMKKENAAFDKPAASIAYFIGKPLAKLLHPKHKKNKKKSKTKSVPAEGV